MKVKAKFSIIAASLALASVSLPITAHADAVAQSILNVTGFQFGAGDGTAAKAAAGSFASNINLITSGATTTADAGANLNGVIDNGSAFGLIGRQAKVGAFGSYVPGAVLAGAPVANYVASTADQTGSALATTATATTGRAHRVVTARAAQRGDPGPVQAPADQDAGTAERGAGRKGLHDRCAVRRGLHARPCLPHGTPPGLHARRDDPPARLHEAPGSAASVRERHHDVTRLRPSTPHS